MVTSAIAAWSGGKDSALALWKLGQTYKVVSLFSNLVDERITMHGVSRQLIERQATSLGLPITFVDLPRNAPDETYLARTQAALQPFIAQQVQHIVYGDLFLQDIREFRDQQFHDLPIKPMYPLWQIDTLALCKTFIEAGFKAIVTCVDTTQLDVAFAGRLIDEAFLHDLPETVDPCGENGEFHTFVFDGPIFSQGIWFERGVTWHEHDRFHYVELMPR